MYKVYKKNMITAPIASYVEGLQQICKNKVVFWASIDTALLTWTSHHAQFSHYLSTNSASMWLWFSPKIVLTEFSSNHL